MPCLEPGPRLDLDAGRTIELDVDAVVLTQRRIALLEPREIVVAGDVDDDSEHRIERGGGRLHGPCNGRTAWSGHLESPVELSVTVYGCVDRLTALPSGAVALLVPPGPHGIDETLVAEFPADELVAFDAALTRAGWEALQDDYSQAHRRFSDGSGGMFRAYWIGPCGGAYDEDRDTRTEVMWYDGEVTAAERSCD